MKLLFINAIYASNIVGGAQRSVQFLAEAMRQKGHECSVICADPTERGESVVNGVTVHRVGNANLYWPFEGKSHAAWERMYWHVQDTYNPIMVRRVAEVLDQEKPDLVHTNILACFSTAAWAPVQKRRIPIVHTLRDFYLACPGSAMFRNGRNCVGQCNVCKAFSISRRAASQEINAVVGNSQFMLQRHLELGFFARTPIRRVVHNAFELDFPVSPRDRLPDPIRLGYFGRIVPNKGVDYILKKLAAAEGINYELRIAGSGDLDFIKSLREQYESERVRFVGVSDARDFFPTIDALIVPSLWNEPLPRVVFESYAFGVPVIASLRGGIPEIVQNGKTGFLYEPDQGDAFIDTLRQLTGDPSRFPAMSRAALEAAKNFLPENIVSSYEAIYQEALAEPAPLV